MQIQVADPNDPRIALSLALDQARTVLTATQEFCGCFGGATCPACVEAAGVAARLATEYQALYAPIVLTARGVSWHWYHLPVARWAWRGDADETEH